MGDLKDLPASGRRKEKEQWKPPQNPYSWHIICSFLCTSVGLFLMWDVHYKSWKEQNLKAELSFVYFFFKNVKLAIFLLKLAPPSLLSNFHLKRESTYQVSSSGIHKNSWLFKYPVRVLVERRHAKQICVLQSYDPYIRQEQTIETIKERDA